MSSTARRSSAPVIGTGTIPAARRSGFSRELDVSHPLSPPFVRRCELDLTYRLDDANAAAVFLVTVASFIDTIMSYRRTLKHPLGNARA